MQITNIAEKSEKNLNGAQQLRIETISKTTFKRDHTHYTDVNKANFHPIKSEQILDTHVISNKPNEKCTSFNM